MCKNCLQFLIVSTEFFLFSFFSLYRLEFNIFQIWSEWKDSLLACVIFINYREISVNLCTLSKTVALLCSTYTYVYIHVEYVSKSSLYCRIVDFHRSWLADKRTLMGHSKINESIWWYHIIVWQEFRQSRDNFE